jgi:hypothetical protein
VHTQLTQLFYKPGIGAYPQLTDEETEAHSTESPPRHPAGRSDLRLTERSFPERVVPFGGDQGHSGARLACNSGHAAFFREDALGCGGRRAHYQCCKLNEIAAQLQINNRFVCH